VMRFEECAMISTGLGSWESLLKTKVFTVGGGA
jgi:hypothetical protein